MEPLTGFYRDGQCKVGPEDRGCHAICCELTSDFLAYSKQCGNDLSTPMPQFNFPGLKPGDRWCVILEATSEAALKYVSRSILEEFAVVAKG